MVYYYETHAKCQGGLVVKEINNNLVVAGVHRGGMLKDGKTYINTGSLFSEIHKSVQENWHPSGNHKLLPYFFI